MNISDLILAKIKTIQRFLNFDFLEKSIHSLIKKYLLFSFVSGEEDSFKC
jgi:hypothetical protein